MQQTSTAGRRGRRIMAALLSLPYLSLLACGNASFYQPVADPAYWPTRTWRTASPESQGLASAELVKALDHVRDSRLPIHSLFIVRHGYVVLDAEFFPYSGALKHNVASVTKSVTATLVGLARDRGLITSLDQPVYPYLRELRPGWGADRQAIRIRDLLAMSSGLDCGYQPGEKELIAMVGSAHWLDAILALPMKLEPGREFAYCSGNTHLLAWILRQAAGAEASTFAAAHLFTALGIDDVAWPADPQGHTRGWSDLQIKPADMAKIGFLYLHGGRWDGGRILSEQWIREAVTPRVTVDKGRMWYGYGWWLYREGKTRLYLARGRGGQRIAVWPQQDMVIVTTGAADPDELFTYVVSAIQAPGALAEAPADLALLRDRLAAARLAPPSRPVSPPPALAGEISGRQYALEPNPLHISTFALRFDRERTMLEVSSADRRYAFAVGLDGVYRTSAGVDGIVAGVRGEWVAEDTFAMDYHEINGINHFQIVARLTVPQARITVSDPTGYYNFSVDGRPQAP